MKKIIVGAVVTFGVLAYGGTMYNKGREDGKAEVLALMDLANKVAEAVKPNVEGA